MFGETEIYLLSLIVVPTLLLALNFCKNPRCKEYFEAFSFRYKPLVWSVFLPLFITLAIAIPRTLLYGINEEIAQDALFYNLIASPFLQPLIEEAFFRGVVIGLIGIPLLTRSKLVTEGKIGFKNISFLISLCLIQAILFAIIHPPHRMLSALLMGTLYGGFYIIYWVLTKQKSLLPPFAAHMANNLAVSIFGLTMP